MRTVVHVHKLSKSERELLKRRWAGRDRYSRLMRRLQKQYVDNNHVTVTDFDAKEMISLLVGYAR